LKILVQVTMKPQCEDQESLRCTLEVYTRCLIEPTNELWRLLGNEQNPEFCFSCSCEIYLMSRQNIILKAKAMQKVILNK
jgi:hypothetical protein